MEREKRTLGERFARSKFVTETKVGQVTGDIFIRTKEIAVPKGVILAKYIRSKLIFGKEKLIEGKFLKKRRKD